MFVRTLVGFALALVVAPAGGAAGMQWFDWHNAVRMPQDETQ